jgi:choline dehydrogenase-like flavoprotein
MSTSTHDDVIIVGTGPGGGTVMALMLSTKQRMSAPASLPPYRATAG